VLVFKDDDFLPEKGRDLMDGNRGIIFQGKNSGGVIYVGASEKNEA